MTRELKYTARSRCKVKQSMSPALLEHLSWRFGSQQHHMHCRVLLLDSSRWLHQTSICSSLHKRNGHGTALGDSYQRILGLCTAISRILVRSCLGFSMTLAHNMNCAGSTSTTGSQQQTSKDTAEGHLVTCPPPSGTQQGVQVKSNMESYVLCH